MNTQHTPTPWAYAPNTMYVLGQLDAFPGIPNPVASPYGRTEAECQANAAFIVHAVNSHEALKEFAEWVLKAEPENSLLALNACHALKGGA